MATPRSTRNPLFLGRWFQDEVIIVAVRWYLTYPLSYRQVCEMLRDRGVSVAASTLVRWVLRYAPEFEKRWQRYEKPVALSWRVDETYIKVGGRWTYLVGSKYPNALIRKATTESRGTGPIAPVTLECNVWQAPLNALFTSREPRGRTPGTADSKSNLIKSDRVF